jgi:peptidoglycan/xylan/chitin deacetylase (PgdA/CDA1 family)
MSNRNSQLLKAALIALRCSGADRLLAPMTRGIGVILMLHHVCPQEPREFDPNRILKVSPQFLEKLIVGIRELGLELVSLDEAHRRISERSSDKRFACITLDDGYRDNREHAYPILRKHGVPFTIYVASDFADGRAQLWWLALEEVIARVDQLSVDLNGRNHVFRCADAAGKRAAFHTVYWWLRGLDEANARRVVSQLCAEIGFDSELLFRDLLMDWTELRQLSGDPLVTIGAHTKSHYALAKLPREAARLEIVRGLDRMQTMLGKRPEHFSYPYGCEQSAGPREFALAREIGFKTAVTTRKGVIFAEHRDHLTALPRISINGEYQDMRCVSVLLSGAPFPFWNGLKRIVAS